MILSILLAAALLKPQSQTPEVIIQKEMGQLRATPDDQRGAATRKIASEIQNLPASNRKAQLANALANVSTEGDFGLTTLQAVADALADSLKTAPDSSKLGSAFDELAQLQRYEHVKVSLKSPEYAAAIKKLDDLEAARHRADFTLEDLEGKSWTLSALKGKVVLVNFWATWCPPCRKEMPDLDRLYSEFKNKGLVILAISDEKKETVTSYLATHSVTYTVLLDPGRKANDAFKMAGIPNSYIFDRKGHLVAEAEDMRTRPQFLKLLSKAGLASSTR